MKRAISLGLLLALTFQAGCYSARPAPVPTSQEDSAAVRTIGDAPEVEITTVQGRWYTVRQPQVEDGVLRGRVGQPTSWWIEIPLDSIAEVQVKYVDPVKTFFGVAATAAGLMGTIFLIALLTKDSCPLVYVVSDTGPVLEGELYSGAIARELERRDFLRLRTVPVESETYTIRLSNEARETQFTDQLALLVIDHEPGVEVLPGTDAALHTIRQPVAPVSAEDGMGRDAAAEVRAPGDDRLWIPDPFGRDLDRPADLWDGLVLRFPVEAGATRAKLAVRLRNTGWADQIAGRYLGLMGDLQEVFYADAEPGSEGGGRLAGFLRDQGLTLNASVWTDGAWTEAGWFHPTGPVGWQDEVLVVPVPPGTDTLTVRLQGGALFWTVDYAAVDYSADQPVRIHVLRPRHAVDSEGTDVTGLLVDADDAYQVLPDRGYSVTVQYDAPPATPGLERSLVLQSEGYYLIHRKQESPPDLTRLAEIQAHPNGFLRFSLEEFWRVTGHQPERASPDATRENRP